MRWKPPIMVLCLFFAACADSSARVTVNVSTPANNATVSSPVSFSASATSNKQITQWRIYVDGSSVYQAGATNSISTSISMAAGTHQVIVRAWASNGTSGSVTLTETVASSTSGTAQGSVTPTSLAFGSLTINTTSSPQVVTVTNTGTATLNITGLSVSPSQFAVSGPGSASIAPGSSAAYNVTFAPTAASSYSGTLSFTTNSATAVAPVTLTGTGVNPTGTAQGTVTPTSLAFGSVTINTTSSSQAVTIKNTGTATLNINGVSISPSQFTVSGPGSASIAPGSSAAYNVTFAPTAASSYSGTLSFTTNSATAVAPVTLSGTGADRTGNASCSGTTYYVSNSGSDSNSGISTTSPWQTVAHVVAFEPSLRAGDCVLFQRGGVWSEELAISNVHGTQTNPITFGNYGTGNLPVLDGGSTRLYGIVGASASGQTANSYVTIDGFEVRNATRGGIIFSYLVQPGITIQNNNVHNNGYGAYPGACAGCFQVDDNQYGYNEGIAMVCYPESSCGVKIINNTVTIEGGHNAIMVDSDHGNPLIQGNRVGPGVTHGGVDFKRTLGTMVKENSVNCSVSVVVNGQTYPGCSATSFWTEQDDSTYAETGTYEQNVSYGAASGYACFGANGISGPISLNYYNNTCYLGSTAANATDLTNCRGGTLTFENNIFDGSGGISLGTCSAVTWDYNDKYGTAGGPSGAHDMSVNPLFVDPSTMDFHLQSTSPVLNSGDSGILGVPYIGACGTSGTCP